MNIKNNLEMAGQRRYGLGVRTSAGAVGGSLLFAAALVLCSVLSGCGGRSSFAIPPVVLMVSLNDTTVEIAPNNQPVYVPVTIVAPTETATFAINKLPAGVSASYKESESNPSGQLTLIANSTTVTGTYMPQIVVGSSGQSASVMFTLVVAAAKN